MLENETVISQNAKKLFHTVKFWLSTEAGDVKGLILAFSAWPSLSFALHDRDMLGKCQMYF